MAQKSSKCGNSKKRPRISHLFDEFQRGISKEGVARIEERVICPHFTLDQLRAEIEREKCEMTLSLAVYQALGCYRCRPLVEGLVQS